MSPAASTTKCVNVRQVPPDLWKRLKIHAATEGITLQAAVAKAIEIYLRAAA